MTLFKQIALLVTLLYFILASIIVVNNFKNAGIYMQGQLQTTAQDMATTLGIAISNHPSGNEPTTLEVLFNSVFDSGYYTRISLISVDGKLIHEKTQNIEIQGVPNWFVHLASLKASSGSTQVIKGWSQLGQLNLTLHPGYAYSSLYQTLVTTLKWFIGFFIVSIILLWVLLHYLLRPLQMVKKQADSIHNNQFVLQDDIPSTQELKSVVIAMNRMVSKIKSVFTEQEKTLGDYQTLLYIDQYTGIGNRRFMLDLIKNAMSEGSSFHGCLAIIKLVNFDELKEQQGFSVADSVIQLVTKLIQQKNNNFCADKVARLSDDEFAILLSSDDDSLIEFIRSVFEHFKQQADCIAYGESFYMVAGVSSLDSTHKVSDLLANIDYCLTMADDAGPYSINKNVTTPFELPHGKMQWRTWLNDAITNNRFFLVGQTAMDWEHNAKQKEMFVRLKNEHNQILPASAFMSMATGLGMSFEIDKAVFDLVKKLKADPENIPVALNLSAAFFDLPSAGEVLDQLLHHAQQKQTKYCFEASHHVLQQHPDMSRHIADKTRALGHQFGLDNLDFSQSLQILQTTRFDYVKISAQTLCDMNKNNSSSAYQALKTITDTLDIDVIAVGVDAQELYDQIQQLGIKLMQGNFLSIAEEQ